MALDRRVRLAGRVLDRTVRPIARLTPAQRARLRREPPPALRAVLVGPLTRGVRTRGGGPLGRGDGVPAELVAQRRHDLHRRAVLLPAGEPRVERRRDHGQRDRVVHRGLDGPAPLAAVLRVPAQPRQVGVLLQRVDHQVQQPGADDRALLPAAHHRGDVGHHVGRLEQLPALGVGLHEAVLDAVVDHLGEVPGSDRAGVDEAAVALGLEHVEERLHERDLLGSAADHEAVALGQPPDATGHPGVHEADPPGLELGGVPLVVGVARVAAVHDDVAGAEQAAEQVDGLVRRGTGGHHHPDHARRRQRGDQRLQAVDIADPRVAVVADDGVPAPAQPLGHVAAHAADPDHPELSHAPSLRASPGPRACACCAPTCCGPCRRVCCAPVSLTGAPA